MLEGISYMIGAEVPGVFVNVMRGGPGLGNIGPEQADIKLACRGLGHGNTHAHRARARPPPRRCSTSRCSPSSCSFRYRNPVVVLGDGYLGQMTGKVQLPADAWSGRACRRGRSTATRRIAGTSSPRSSLEREPTSRRTTST